MKLSLCCARLLSERYFSEDSGKEAVCQHAQWQILSVVGAKKKMFMTEETAIAQVI